MKGKRRFCGGVRPPTQQDISKGVPASGSNNDNEPSVVVPNQVNSKIEESCGVWIGINGTVLTCETEAITPVKKTETMEKQRSHPLFVFEYLSKWSKHNVRDFRLKRSKERSRVHFHQKWC
ncbi:unnamed protein product [Brassica oleracea]